MSCYKEREVVRYSTMRRQILHLLIPIFLFHGNLWAEELNATAMSYDFKILNHINKGPFSYSCGQEQLTSKSCPFAFKLFASDKEDGFLHQYFNSAPGQSPLSACENFPKRRGAGLWHGDQLESEYAHNRFTKLGLDPNFITKSISQCYHPELSQGDPNSVQYEKNTIVAMTYHYLNRVKKGNQQSFLEVSNINSLLGKPLNDAVACDTFITPDDASLCLKNEELKCRPQGGLKKLATSLALNAIRPILQLKKKILSVNPRRSSGQIKKLKNAIKMIEATYPILKGDEFKNYLDDHVYNSLAMPTPQSLEKALTKQLESNKKAVLKRIEKNNGLNRCLIYGNEDDCDNFDKNMAKNPHDTRSFLYTRKDILSGRGHKNIDKMGSASSYYGSIACFDDFRNIKTRVNNLAVDTGVNIGLVIATMGAGAIVGLGRTAMLVSRGISFSADLAFLGESTRETIKSCKESFNQLVGDKYYNQSDKFQCPGGPDDLHFTAVDDMRSCITSAALLPLGVLPFVPIKAWKGLRISADEEMKNLMAPWKFRLCNHGLKLKKCEQYIEENRSLFKKIAQSCTERSFAMANKEACEDLEKFMIDHNVLRLSDLIPVERQGKSVVVEFSSNRGHVVLRYMIETVDKKGNKVMKAVSQDGSSFLMPRRINEKWFQGRKDINELGNMDKYVPGSHYIIDATPAQLETMFLLQQKGGLSRACTHDARRALHEAGILKMPRGLKSPYEKIGIRKLASDLTEKFGSPNANTTRAIKNFLEKDTAGFSREQWKTFFKTEAGWMVLTPLAVFGAYPSLAFLAPTVGLIGADEVLTLTDHEGNLLAIEVETLKKIYQAYLDLGTLKN